MRNSAVPLAGGAQRPERRRDVEDQRRVGEVAEVQHAADVAVVDEQVVEREVAVHDLGAQSGPGRRHPLLEAVERGLHQAAGRRVADVARRARGCGRDSSTCQSSRRPAAGWKNPRRARAVRAAIDAVGDDGVRGQVGPEQARLTGEPVVGPEEVGRTGLRMADDAVARAEPRSASGVLSGRPGSAATAHSAADSSRSMFVAVSASLESLTTSCALVVADQDDLVAFAVEDAEDGATAATP